MVDDEGGSREVVDDEGGSREVVKDEGGGREVMDDEGVSRGLVDDEVTVREIADRNHLCDLLSLLWQCFRAQTGDEDEDARRASALVAWAFHHGRALRSSSAEGATSSGCFERCSKQVSMVQHYNACRQMCILQHIHVLRHTWWRGKGS